MPNGQITDRKIPLEVFGGTKTRLVRQERTTVEGVLTTSPTGDWELIALSSSTLRRIAQARSVGSQRIGTSAFQTIRISPKDVSVVELTILETKPGLEN